jgi:hypothetical protein
MKKKITIKELKSLIKEEAHKLQIRTLLESEKKALKKELGEIIGEGYKSAVDLSNIDDRLYWLDSAKEPKNSPISDDEIVYNLTVSYDEKGSDVDEHTLAKWILKAVELIINNNQEIDKDLVKSMFYFLYKGGDRLHQSDIGRNLKKQISELLSMNVNKLTDSAKKWAAENSLLTQRDDSEYLDMMKEEASKLQRRTLLENEKKALQEELGMMGEDPYYDDSNPNAINVNLDGTGDLTADGRKVPNTTSQDDYALDSNQYGEEIKGMSAVEALGYLIDQGLEQEEAVRVISQHVDGVGDEIRGDFSDNRVVDYE